MSAEEAKIFSFSVDLSQNKERLDKFLAKSFLKENPEITRSKIKHLIENGNVTLSGTQITDPACKIKDGENFTIEIPVEKNDLTPKEIEFETIYEDNDLLVINKPAGLTTHPGAGNQDNTLVNALLYSKKELSEINGEFRPGIVHRLDKDTSGLMIVAKNDFAHLKIAKQIEERSLSRSYIAFCYGVIMPGKGTINKNIGRDKNDRLKMAIYNNGGKSAITHYKTLEAYQNLRFSKVECNLETGRTHQIRVHLSSINHSIIGDKIYSGKFKINYDKINKDSIDYVKNFPRQALHSYRISFIHPRSEKIMEFVTDLPKDMQELEILLKNG